jgi:hypothetical protein
MVASPPWHGGHDDGSARDAGAAAPNAARQRWCRTHPVFSHMDGSGEAAARNQLATIGFVRNLN